MTSFPLSVLALAGALLFAQQVEPQDSENARAFAADYLRLKDAGRYREAFDLHTNGLREMEPYEFFSASDKHQAGQWGALKDRQLLKVSWFRDPAGMPKGAYASIDIKSVFENVDLHCGFIYLRLMPNGSFLVEREHWVFIDKRTAAALDTNNQLAPAWELLGRSCRV